MAKSEARLMAHNKMSEKVFRMPFKLYEANSERLKEKSLHNLLSHTYQEVKYGAPEEDFARL